MTREFHEAANIFPMLPDDELQSLAEDIKTNGLQVPIELLDDKIIDGRNRYRACQIVGVTPKMVKVYTEDPIAYVMTVNLHRRHLTPSQRAMAAARAREKYDQQAKDRQEATQITGGKPPVVETLPPPGREAENRDFGKSRDQAGKIACVSGRTVDKASKVLAEAPAETVKAVTDGKMTVTAAVRGLEKAKAPEVVRDADGVPVPKPLLPIFATASEFETFANKISRLKGEFESSVESNPEAWSAIEPQKRVAEFASLRYDFIEARPYLICPVCGGEDPEHTCMQCNGRAWLSRHRARSVGIDLRNPQRRANGLDPLTRSSQRAGEVTT